MTIFGEPALMKGLRWLGLSLVSLLLPGNVFSQVNPNAFQPITWEFPQANECRLASGAPGPSYWQQKADYKMWLNLDDLNQRLSGREIITYHNNSPHSLTYLWLQIDQEYHRPGSLADKIDQDDGEFDPSERSQIPGGCDISDIQQLDGRKIPFFINETNLRLDLPTALAPGATIQFEISWAFNINDATIEGRSGYERFPDGNYVYEMAQFFPRMCLYDDVKGWQNMPFLGPAEFALEFGDYDVSITVPSDHVVAATGLLQNEAEVLSGAQSERLKNIRNSVEKVQYVVTPEEAEFASNGSSKGLKTWHFKAENVRDFAFASSRKFVWDAATVFVGDKPILAQAIYPREGMPLWNRYGTHAVMHTLKVYSRFTVDYPYPTAQAVHGPVWGMEYPMICFCGGRPERNGTYSKQIKYAMISVIIHEVGHNFFPMIINNDERRWAFLDEGFNSFLEYWAEQEWEPNFPSRRGLPSAYGPTMLKGTQNPIMTNPESIVQNGKISYEKTMVGLVMLRNTIIGRSGFDFAFKEYARRWAFHHPEPADFFRTMEDVSGSDLSWFWRGWFMGTATADFDLQSVKFWKEDPSALPLSVGEKPGTRNPSPVMYYVDERPELIDAFSKEKPPVSATPMQRLLDWLEKNPVSFSEEGEVEKPRKHAEENKVFTYSVEITNKGTLPMPVILQVAFEDGTQEDFRFPAHIWVKNNVLFRKEFRFAKPAKAFVLDPYGEIPDSNPENNFYPRM